MSNAYKLFTALGIVLVLAMALWVIQNSRRSDPLGRKFDIYYSYVEGQRILQGTNPYSRIHAGDMRANNKYATYFPGFYVLSAAAQAIGASDTRVWLSIWRTVFATFYLAIGILVFVIGCRTQNAMLGLFGASLWFFNRWTMQIVNSVNIDFPPLFFMLLSLALFNARRTGSLLLLGMSLALKQIAIFLVPLYLIWIWNEHKGPDRLKHAAFAALLIAAVPLAFSLPFLAWDAAGFVKSLLFSATRLGSSGTPTIDQLLGWTGLAGRIPMLVVLAFVYVAAMRWGLGRFTSALCVMITFTMMNPIFFAQYFCWVAPLIPLAVCDRPPIRMPGSAGA